MLSAGLLLTAAALPAAVVGQSDSTRATAHATQDRDVNFNENWKFYRGTSNSARNKDFGDSAWENVSIPHDFSITQDFTTTGTEVESGWLSGGTGWYRKHFTVDPADAGKALVIVRSTKNGGSFTLTASASGLTGDSVTVTTPEIVTAAGGVMTAVAPGTAAVTAAAGGYSAVCTVTVNALTEEPQKIAPTVTVRVTYQNSRITVTGQSDIFVNPELYYTEVKHGILYIPSSMLGSRNLLVSTSGAANKVLTGFEEDGTFSHTFKPLSGSMAYTYRAYVYYEKPDGSRIYVYSPMVRGSGRSFQVG